MELRHNMPLLLLVGWGVVDVALLVWFMVMDLAGVGGNVAWDPIFLGLVSVQGSVVAAWLYLSDHWPLWHALSLLILIVTLAACGPQPLTTSLIVALHLLVMALIHLPLGILRDRGWRYRFHVALAEGHRPWQFSLSELVGFTFTAAVCLGLWQMLGWLNKPAVLQPYDAAIAIVLALGSLVWTPAIRVLAGLVRSRYVFAIALVLGTLHLRLMTIYTPYPGSRSVSTMLLVLIAGAVMLILHAAALRSAGWRIERDPHGRKLRSATVDAVHGEAEVG